MRILILGANGFIGNSLVRAILERTEWLACGIDLRSDRLIHSLDHSRFEFVEGDITVDRAWVDRQIQRCDVVVPLVAIARPMAYVTRPLEVFELTFEENLRIVKNCGRAGTRLVFPSSSEVYGMCPDAHFDEESSNLVLGPIHKERWIYASAKQLLDRVIWSMGTRAELDFTIVRPFNWIGPKLDDPDCARQGGSRVVAQFIADLFAGKPIRLVDGGGQRRCFSYIDDGIDCLMRVLHNAGGRARGGIFNIGNPENECSIRELAERLCRLYGEHPAGRGQCKIVEVSSADHYGPGYQDVATRTPSIGRATAQLGWTPRVDLDEALHRTLHGCLEDRSTFAA